jgi:putative DNA primase/helicase
MTPKEPLNGGAIRLFESAKIMGVAEGIETALAAAKLEELPVWACANANMLEQWKAPEGVEWVHIYADNDQNYTGQAAAYKLANRLSLAGLKVLVCVPDMFGDWNDELLRSNEITQGKTA